jgi:flagellar biogenesis protein FliO
MGGYVVNFTVYTMAMIGLICFAVFVYKKITDGSFSSKNSKYLKLEETMSLTPRKSLHVVSAGKEKFLIASDVDRTTLIAKLQSSEPVGIKISENINKEIKNIEKETKDSFEEVVQQVEAGDGGVDINPKDDKVVHLESIYPSKKRVAVRQAGTKVQRRRTMPKPQVTEDYKKRGHSPIKEMAKRINEL